MTFTETEALRLAVAFFEAEQELREVLDTFDDWDDENVDEVADWIESIAAKLRQKGNTP